MAQSRRGDRSRGERFHGLAPADFDNFTRLVRPRDAAVAAVRGGAGRDSGLSGKFFILSPGRNGLLLKLNRPLPLSVCVFETQPVLRPATAALARAATVSDELRDGAFIR